MNINKGHIGFILALCGAAVAAIVVIVLLSSGFNSQTTASKAVQAAAASNSSQASQPVATAAAPIATIAAPTATIRDSYQASPTAEGRLSITAVADTFSLPAAGDVKFKITVDNSSDILLVNLQISEKGIGKIDTISALGKENKMIEKIITVKKTTQFNFSISAELPDGSIINTTTDPLTITVGK